MYSPRARDEKSSRPVVFRYAGGASFSAGMVGQARGRTPVAQFYAPGPIVEAVIIQPSHPMFYGYTLKNVSVRYANGPLLAPRPGGRARQADADAVPRPMLPSERADEGAAETRNRPAIAEVQSGKGAS
jgi:hypothetical protein